MYMLVIGYIKDGESPPSDAVRISDKTRDKLDKINIDVAKQYMSLAYSPTHNKGAESVRHLCTPDSWFWSPSTFPGCLTPMDYADSHAQVMASVNDLHIVRYDQEWAKDGHVLLRYTAEGSHAGKPYKGIEKSDPPRKARWSAAAIFEIQDGKIKSFTKDWDQKVMQIADKTDDADPAWVGAGARIG
ncbi:hypothetical protein An02g13260 [Aspergillus niger]|uniref:NTF2-like protein n=2 Tax=Aspergillus niger TaxID=5061 RepID=A2QF46_ASPNC|nr:hypothetical protein An02g13260 [Aspergillus niger]CAK47739.1 hypothetical protein An02g13260 [Aspergillus niger]